MWKSKGVAASSAGEGERAKAEGASWGSPGWNMTPYTPGAEWKETGEQISRVELERRKKATKGSCEWPFGNRKLEMGRKPSFPSKHP